MGSRQDLLALPKVVLFVCTAVLSGFAQNVQTAQVSRDLRSANPEFTELAPRGHASPALSALPRAAHGIDSLPSFSGHFQATGVDDSGKKRSVWRYNIAGKSPQEGGTTVIDAPIVPVSLDLLNYDGSGHTLHYSVVPFILPTIYSPIFQSWNYSSSDVPTQLIDAELRAEFYNTMKPNWHTLLNPSLKTVRTMSVPAGSYYYQLKRDGRCCEYVLIDSKVFGNLLFPPIPGDTTTPVGAAENGKEITTKDISTFLFPNTYLYDGDPANCCVLGYHSYDYEPGDASNGFAEKRYVLNFSSWISSGLFGDGVEDITATSHELAESFNDPFVVSDKVHNLTPWWVSPNGNCQDDLEVGDAIEGLPLDVYPITMNGRTYHPQNVALLQWFAFESPSSALGGAYSYPNPSTLTTLSLPQGANCK
jgi:hypothetical protein